jgi:replicative DNA helicase
LSKQGKLLMAALIASKDVTQLYAAPDLPDLMSDDPYDQKLWSVIDKHVLAYGKLPTPKTLSELWTDELPVPEEPMGYYLDQLRPAHVRKRMQVAVAEANKVIADDPMAALSILEQSVVKLTAIGGPQVLDLRKSHDLLMKHLKTKWSGAASYHLGWPGFDDTSGGMMGGDFITMVGKSGLGKTWMILSRALHVWKHHKVPVVFITMEVMRERLLERAASIMSKTPANYMKHGILPNLFQKADKKLADMFKELEDFEVPFYIVDGNLAASVVDAQRIVRQVGAKALFADGAYLMKVPGGTRNPFERISQGAEFLKGEIATKLRVPVFATYQFNRSTKELKKGQRPGLDHIAGSDDIGRLSSVVLGMFEDQDSPETINTREIAVIKGRDGETGTIKVHWDFNKMNFDQVMHGEEDQELEIA